MKQKWLKSGGALLMGLLVISLAACGGGKSGSPAGSAAPAPTAGTESNEAFVKAQEMFTTNKCISCHGVDLAGKVGPRTNLQKVGGSMSKEQIANKIKNGGGGMPAYKEKLSDDEIGQLADWLSSKK